MLQVPVLDSPERRRDDPESADPLDAAHRALEEHVQLGFISGADAAQLSRILLAKTTGDLRAACDVAPLRRTLIRDLMSVIPDRFPLPFDTALLHRVLLLDPHAAAMIARAVVAGDPVLPLLQSWIFRALRSTRRHRVHLLIPAADALLELHARGLTVPPLSLLHHLECLGDGRYRAQHPAARVAAVMVRLALGRVPTDWLDALAVASWTPPLVLAEMLSCDTLSWTAAAHIAARARGQHLPHFVTDRRRRPRRRRARPTPRTSYQPPPGGSPPASSLPASSLPASSPTPSPQLPSVFTRNASVRSESGRLSPAAAADPLPSPPEGIRYRERLACSWSDFSRALDLVHQPTSWRAVLVRLVDWLAVAPPAMRAEFAACLEPTVRLGFLPVIERCAGDLSHPLAPMAFVRLATGPLADRHRHTLLTALTDITATLSSASDFPSAPTAADGIPPRRPCWVPDAQASYFIALMSSPDAEIRQRAFALLPWCAVNGTTA